MKIKPVFHKDFYIRSFSNNKLSPITFERNNIFYYIISFYVKISGIISINAAIILVPFFLKRRFPNIDS